MGKARERCQLTRFQSLYEIFLFSVWSAQLLLGYWGNIYPSVSMLDLILHDAREGWKSMRGWEQSSDRNDCVFILFRLSIITVLYRRQISVVCFVCSSRKREREATGAAAAGHPHWRERGKHSIISFSTYNNLVIWYRILFKRDD